MRMQADRDEDLALGRELERKEAEIERLRKIIEAAEDFIPATKLGELARMRDEIERLRAALKPFAEWARDETRKPSLDDCQRASAVFTNTARRSST